MKKCHLFFIMIILFSLSTSKITLGQGNYEHNPANHETWTSDMVSIRTPSSISAKNEVVQDFDGVVSAIVFNPTRPILNAPNGCSETDSLTVRNAHAMAYDRDQTIVLLFGGADERQVLADLWAWNGEQWRCLSDGGPPPRTFPALAYNSARKRLVLFGGNRVLFGTAEDTNTFLNDMWSWDGQTWHQIHTATPPARAEASMAYDSGRQRMVLFGGHRIKDGERVRFGDTWEWNGHQWDQKSTDGPAPRNGTAMAYDSHRQRIVLFGGSGNSGETWEWDGQAWELIKSAETDARFNSSMAYDAGRHVTIRFGGWTKQGRVGDTWRYDGTQWMRITNDGPAGRNHTSIAYDSRREVILLFGGHDGDRVFGDTWEWNGNRWSHRAETAPRLRVDNGH